MGWREESEQLERQLTGLRESIRAGTPLEQWFEHFNELSKRDRDLYIRLYWPTLLDSTDAEAEKAFGELLSTAYPRLEALLAECLEAAANHPNLPTDGIHGFIANIWKSQQKNSTPASASLLAQEQFLVAEYNRLLGGLRVDSSNGPMNLTQSQNLRKHCAEPSERRRLWEKEVEARLTVTDQVDQIALRLIRLRRRIARESGFGNYAEYVFNRERRFDFSPAELLETVRLIREACGPLSSRFDRFRKKLLGTGQLQPWDSECEIGSSAENLVAIDEATLAATVIRAMDSLGSEFGSIVRLLFADRRADLWQREGKRSGAWSTYLSRTAEALISTNNTGTPSDFFATFHEIGHAIHFSLRVKDRPYWLHQCSNDINEFAAFTIQCLGIRELKNSPLIDSVQLRELNLNVLSSALRYINEHEQQERFTHQVFALPDDKLNTDTLDQIYLEVTADDTVDWSGYESTKAKLWHTHRFIPRPFYASEYIVAWLMTMLALEVIDRDRSTGMETFKTFLRHSEWGFKKVLSLWGIGFPFTPEVLTRMAAQLCNEFGFHEPV